MDLSFRCTPEPLSFGFKYHGTHALMHGDKRLCQDSNFQLCCPRCELTHQWPLYRRMTSFTPPSVQFLQGPGAMLQLMKLRRSFSDSFVLKSRRHCVIFRYNSINCQALNDQVSDLSIDNNGGRNGRRSSRSGKQCSPGTILGRCSTSDLTIFISKWCAVIIFNWFSGIWLVCKGCKKFWAAIQPLCYIDRIIVEIGKE